MLDSICDFLTGLADVDNGVESVLTVAAFDGFINLIRNVYGRSVAETVENFFTQREDGSFVCSVEQPADIFLACLARTI